MEKAKFYLVKLPITSILVFFSCCVIAALIYPGSQKEIIGYQSEVYSFTQFPQWAREFTNQYWRNQSGNYQEDNTPSMLLFNGSLILIGATLMLFYVQFKKVFVLIEDSSKAQFYAKITTPVGLLAVFYAGLDLFLMTFILVPMYFLPTTLF